MGISPRSTAGSYPNRGETPAVQTKPLIDHLVPKMLGPDRRRLAGMLTELNKKNRRLQDAKVDGFIHMGQWYLPRTESVTIAHNSLPKTTLHRSLYAEMDAYLAEEQALGGEIRQMSQMLFLLLDPCQNQQDIRDALPECLVNQITGLNDMPRQREAAWTIQDNPRAMRQYEKILPIMEVYSTAGLLY